MPLNRCRYILFKSIIAFTKNNVQIIRMESDRNFQKIQNDLRDIFHASVNAVLPHKLIENKIRFLYRRVLFIGEQSYNVKNGVYIVGFGKAVMPMALALDKILNGHIKRGIISVPRGSLEKLSQLEQANNHQCSSSIEFYEGGLNNQPDDSSLETTRMIVDLLKSLSHRDTVIVLISGGGSALLVQPKRPVTLTEKQRLCQKLQNAGADITELNTVRIALSEVKGGGLASIASSTFLISLILSDIIGDPLNLIASGPTVNYQRDSDSVIKILKKYKLMESLTENLLEILMKESYFENNEESESNLENVKEENNLENFKEKSNMEDDKFQHVVNILLGNNMVALEEAQKHCFERELNSIILSNCVNGDVQLLSQAYAELVSLICDSFSDSTEEETFVEQVQKVPVLSLSCEKSKELWKLTKSIDEKGIVLICGGESTVKVKGSGKGGRNQQLALSFSLDWSHKIMLNSVNRKYDVIFLSAGSDGQDGPTDAAGAFGYPQIGSIILDLKLKSLEAKKLVDKSTNGRIDLDAVEEFKEFQNWMLKEKKNYIVKDFVEKVLEEIEYMDPKNIINCNDSYNFYSKFRKGLDLIKCGITGTNVMDLHFIYIKRKSCCGHSENNEEKKVNVFLNHDLYRIEENEEIFNATSLPEYNPPKCKF